MQGTPSEIVVYS